MLAALIFGALALGGAGVAVWKGRGAVTISPSWAPPGDEASPGAPLSADGANAAAAGPQAPLYTVAGTGAKNTGKSTAAPMFTVQGTAAKNTGKSKRDEIYATHTIEVRHGDATAATGGDPSEADDQLRKAVEEAFTKARGEFSKLSTSKKKAGAAAVNKLVKDKAGVELGLTGAESFDQVVTKVKKVAVGRAGRLLKATLGDVQAELGAMVKGFLGKDPKKFLDDILADIKEFLGDTADDLIPEEDIGLDF